MVRCSAKTNTNRRCKLHCMKGGTTCTRHVIQEVVLNQIQEKESDTSLTNRLYEYGKPLTPQPFSDDYSSNYDFHIKDKHNSEDVIDINRNPVCDHYHCLTNAVCCACADKRPIAFGYSKHIVGLGDLLVGERQDEYCSSCKFHNKDKNPLFERKNGIAICKEIRNYIIKLIDLQQTLYEKNGSIIEN